MLDINDLSIRLGDTALVENLSLQLPAGGRLGIIGESGSGKSLTALAIMGLLDDTLAASGSVTLAGEELLGLPDRAMRRYRGNRIAMVFQEPMTALDPLMTVGRQLAEAAGGTHDVDKLLADVHLDSTHATRYPHELSGGQRQRVLIAMAIAGDPDVLICDEPTTALDVTVQDQVLTLLENLAEARDMALLFVTHDLAVIARMCPQVLVMREGKVVEAGATAAVLTTPVHDYTRALVTASQPGPPAPTKPTGAPVAVLDRVTRTFGGRNALNAVSLTLNRGERLGIVGGSGSGKTTLLKILAGLDAPTTGTVTRPNAVQMVFQDPQSSLNPRLRIGRSIAEACGGDGDRVAEVLTEVGLSPEHTSRYPHEFSGGQRQRISIARAISPKPQVLLADEPVSALDVSVRSQVLAALEELVDGYDLTMVFVSHDLSVVRQVCSRVIVMRDGEIVERGATEDLWANPQHPYTQALLDAVPTL